MNSITIIVNGDKEREYEFQTLDDETAKLVIELLLRQTDNTIATLNQIAEIKMDDPPDVELLE